MNLPPLPQTEERYRSLFENNHSVMLIIDPASGRIVDANHAAEAYYGWPRETLLSLEIADINTLPREEIKAEMARAQAEQRKQFFFRHRLADGTIRDVEVFSGPIRIGTRELLYSIVHDVTDQRLMEDTLSHLTQRALCLLDLPRLADTLDETSLMQGGLEMAEQLTDSSISFIHFVNQDEETIELVTWSRRTLGTYCKAAFDRHYPVSQAGIWAEALRRREAVMFNDYASAPDRRGLPEGHAALQRLVSVPVVEHGKVVMLAGVDNKAVDYTERDAQSLQLIANDLWRLVQRGRSQRKIERFSRLLERSRNEIYSFELESLGFIDVNRGALDNLGYTLDQMRGLSALDLMRELDAAEFAAIVAPLRARSEQSVTFVSSHARKDGSSYPVEVHLEITDEANPLFVAVVRDITERRRGELALRDSLERLRTLNARLEQSQNQLLQSEKMASVGQLAAGVAHELNNPISFVSSNIGSLEIYLRDLFAIVDAYAATEASPQPCCPQLDQAHALKRAKDFDFLRQDIVQLMAESKDGLSRVTRIVRDLKDFSHAGEAAMQWADLHQGLDSTLNVVRSELKQKCTVVKHYGELPAIWCEPFQLNQVFMNLLVNAAHAIPSQGEITLRTGRVGDQVFVSIADTGTGISAQHLDRIFEPFFTTKPVGKGTGLGLSLAYSIVQKHHGRIEVVSTPGQGSCFTVWLPLRPEAKAQEDALQAADPGCAKPPPVS